ncbi:type II secretion system protein GspM [Pokkaliibacter sp. MBI-7]|uniref:type II secretion system protein GspM n=1 Tax=Pokkaliibacter sp. MBI-7 TaxID=3040600 RepID=UPI00244A027D|nr:type II secretion system protein GspM [Pokkaliibacter sp. MBI-7]MDH2433005.1 type II secretion system protein GspM [Pokkaliibacter sp. MBI-7]
MKRHLKTTLTTSLTTSLTAAQQRLAMAVLILLALLLTAATALYQGVWAPVQEMREQMDSLRQRQQRYQQILAGKEQLQAAVEAAAANSQLNNTLLPGDDPGSVQADLMSRLSLSVNQVSTLGPGCQLLETLPVSQPQKQDAPYVQVAINVTLECAMEPLTAVVYELEHSHPLLFIDQLSLYRRPDTPFDGGSGLLTVRMTVSGYMHPAAQASSGAGG